MPEKLAKDYKKAIIQRRKQLKSTGTKAELATVVRNSGKVIEVHGTGKGRKKGTGSRPGRTKRVLKPAAKKLSMKEKRRRAKARKGGAYRSASDYKPISHSEMVNA